MAEEHVQGWVTKNDTDNLEVHYQDSKQQGFEKKGEYNQIVAIYNLAIAPHDHA